MVQWYSWISFWQKPTTIYLECHWVYMQHSIISHLFPPLSASNNSSAALHSTIRKLKLWRIFNSEAISHGSRGVYAEEQNQNFTRLIIYQHSKYQYDSLVSTCSCHLNDKTTLILRKLSIKMTNGFEIFLRSFSMQGQFSDVFATTLK